MILEESLVGNPLVQIVWQRLQGPGGMTYFGKIPSAERLAYFQFLKQIPAWRCNIRLPFLSLVFLICYPMLYLLKGCIKRLVIRRVVTVHIWLACVQKFDLNSDGHQHCQQVISIVNNIGRAAERFLEWVTGWIFDPRSARGLHCLAHYPPRKV